MTVRGLQTPAGRSAGASVGEPDRGEPAGPRPLPPEDHLALDLRVAGRGVPLPTLRLQLQLCLLSLLKRT